MRPLLVLSFVLLFIVVIDNVIDLSLSERFLGKTYFVHFGIGTYVAKQSHS